MTIKELQKRAYDNKVKHNFNVTDIPLEFCYLNRELGEAFEAYQNKSNKIGEELADTGIYLLGLCEIIGVDLEKEMLAKMDINETRTYIGNSKYRLELNSLKLENTLNFVLVSEIFASKEKIMKESLIKNIDCKVLREMSNEEFSDNTVILVDISSLPFGDIEDYVLDILKKYPRNIKVILSIDNITLDYLYHKLNYQDMGMYSYNEKECKRIH